MKNTLQQQAVSLLQNILKLEKIHGTTNENVIKHLIDRLNDRCFRIAVVGEFSSGKSTFLNSLIGKDLLKHGTLETTATITEIVNTQNINADVCDVFFRNGENISISCSKLEEYTSVSSQTYNVAHDIRKVIIKSHIFETNIPVVFIDTPGLNGVADRHREQTIDQIEHAHACVYLIQSRGLTKSDIDFICEEVGTYQKTFLFVQNFIDELSALEGENLESRLKELNEIIIERILPKNPDMSYKIVGISSKEALLSRDDERKIYEGIELTTDIRRKMLDKSKFNEVINALLLMVQSNQKSAKQDFDTLKIALEKLDDIYHTFMRKNEEINVLKNKPQHKIEELRTKFSKNIEPNRKKIQSFIDEQVESIYKQCQTSITEGVNTTKEIIDDRIDEIDNFPELTNFMDLNVKHILNKNLHSMRDDLHNWMTACLENIIATTILKIQKFTCMEDKNTEIKINFDPLEFCETDYHPEDSTLENYKIQVIGLRTENQKLENEKNSISRDQEKTQSMLAKNKEYSQYALEIYNNKIKNLGNCPDPIMKTRREIRTRKRKGFWGGFMTIFVGDEEYEEIVSYSDTTNQEKWKHAMASIKCEYEVKINKLKRDESELKTKQEQNSSNKQKINENIRRNKESIDYREKLIKELENLIRTEKEKAYIETLRRTKDQAKNHIKDYLFHNMEPSVINSCKKRLYDYKDKVTNDYIMPYYKEYCDARLHELETLLADYSLHDKNKLWKNNAEEILSSINILKSLIKDLKHATYC